MKIIWIALLFTSLANFCYSADETQKDFCSKNPNHNKCLDSSKKTNDASEVDLAEVLDQKIYKNSYINKKDNNNTSMSLFMNPYDNSVPDYTSGSSLNQNSAMQEQITRLNKLQRLQYEPEYRKDYIYGFGISIPLNNKNNKPVTD